MISDDDKTPSVVTISVENGRTPPPVVTPRPTLTVLKRPPLGRPPGALSIAEMVEQITRDVRGAAMIAVERRHVELRAEHARLRAEQVQVRAEMAAEIKMATGLAIAAILMNALALVASLAFSRGRALALTCAALTAVFVGAVRLGVRRKAASR